MGERSGDQQWTVDKTVDGTPYSFIIRQAQDGNVALSVFQPQHIQKWNMQLTPGQLAGMGISDQDWQLALIDRVVHQDGEPQLDVNNDPSSAAPMQAMPRKLQYQRGRKVNEEHMLVSMTNFEDNGRGIVDVVVYNVKSGERVCAVLPGGDNCSSEESFQVWCEAMLERLNASTSGSGPLSISFS